MNAERISAITIKVHDMATSVHFYSKLLGMKILYGGENAQFSSLQTLGAKDAVLNLEQGHVTPNWGRIIFYVEDVDRFWAYLTEKEFNPDSSVGRKVLPHVRSGWPRTIICSTNRLRLLGSPVLHPPLAKETRGIIARKCQSQSRSTKSR